MRKVLNIAVLALGLTSCGPSGETPPEATGTPPASDRVSERPLTPSPPKAYRFPEDAALGRLPDGIGLPVGTRAPSVSFVDTEGKTVRLTELVDKQKVLLFFYRGGW